MKSCFNFSNGQMEKVKYKSGKTKNNCTMLFQVCNQNTIVIVSFEGNDKTTVGLILSK